MGAFTSALSRLEGKEKKQTSTPFSDALSRSEGLKPEDTGIGPGINRGLNPIPVIKDLAELYGQSFDDPAPAPLLRTAGKLAKGVAGMHWNELTRAWEEAKQGRYVDAAATATLGAIPLVGPYVSQLADRAGKGDWKGAMAEVVSGIAGPKMLGAAVRFAGKAPLGGTKAGAAVAKDMAEQKNLDRALGEAVSYKLEQGATERTSFRGGANEPRPAPPPLSKPVQGMDEPLDVQLPPPPLVNRAAVQRDMAQSARAAMAEAASMIPTATSPEAMGAGVQNALRQGSTIWHRRGGELYDQANALLRGVQVSTEPVKKAADKILFELQSARELFPESSVLPADMVKALNEITSLPATAPYEALDAYRKVLITKLPGVTDIAPAQREGIVKLLTKGLTESMVQGAEAVGGDAAKAAAAARAFWREGAELFDNAILTKAMKSNPEDVLSLLKPEGSMRPPSITEARRIREGVLDYAQKYGTDAEKAAARAAYNTFLETVADKGLRAGDIMTLPDNYASFGETIGVLYGATPEGKVMLRNLDNVVNAIAEMKSRTMGIPKQVVTKPSRSVIDDIRLSAKGEKRLTKERKLAEDAAAKAEAESTALRAAQAKQASQQRVQAVEGAIAGEDATAKANRAVLERYQGYIANALGTVAALGVGREFGLTAGSIAGAGAGFWGVRGSIIQILKSPKATSYLVNGINTAPVAEMLGHPTTGMWLASIRQASEIAQGKPQPRAMKAGPDDVRSSLDDLRSRHGQNWDAALAEVNRHYRDNPPLWKQVRNGIVDERKRAKSAPTAPQSPNMDSVGPLASGLARTLRESGNNHKPLLDSWRKLKLIPNDILDALERESGVY